MSYRHARILNVYESSDHQVRVDVLARNDGFFEFRAYARRFEEFTKEYYWAPTVNSGIYASAEDAERDALNEALSSGAKPKSGN